MYYKPILPLLLINIMLYYRILQRKNMEILHISKCLIILNGLQQYFQHLWLGKKSQSMHLWLGCF
jgi:hypothetical protein